MSLRNDQKTDFFISYSNADRPWADWMAWELRQAGYTTLHQHSDFAPGANFVVEMQNALERCERTIAIYSPNYFNSGFCEDEWTSALVTRSLICVRVRECEIPKLLKTRAYIDLMNLDETGARATLLDALQPARVRQAPPFPSTTSKPSPFPGRLPEIWQVPHLRNPNFTGRDQLLRDLRSALMSGRPAALTQAIAGLGGVGKTQLALEYAYRYACEYSLVWWLRAEESATFASDYTRLAVRLNLPEKDLPSQPDIVAAVREWLAHNSGWLLIFDNVPSPQHCSAYRPRSNTGHILITSRSQDWRGTAQPLAVQSLSRDESLAFLRKRIGRDEPEAEPLSEEVGDLPLALEHAAAYIDATGISIGEYLDLYRKYADELLKPVQGTWNLSFDRLQQEHPAALELLRLIAYLGPENIPRDLLQPAAPDPLAFNKLVESLRRYSLIKTGEGTIGVHRLVQETTRNGLPPSERCRWAEAALKLVNVRSH